MCLYLKKGNARIKTATEDIICYKIMLEVYPGYGSIVPTYKTPYQGVYMPIEGLVDDEYFKLNQWARKCYNHSTKRRFHITSNGVDNVCKSLVSEGMIHTFVNLEDASHHSDYMFKCNYDYLSTLKNRYVVVKCVIPKGTSYYEGFTSLDGVDTFTNGYCSATLKFTGEIVDRGGQLWKEKITSLNEK